MHAVSAPTPPPDLSTVRFVAGGNPADAAFQLKSLVKALHAAGIEVLLEVSTKVDRSTAQYLKTFVCVLDHAHGWCENALTAMRVLSKLFVPATVLCVCVCVWFNATTNCRLMVCAFVALRSRCPKPSTG